jgi:UDP-N-acetylglucosamine acyltransferase
MAVLIADTACVDPRAEIADDVEIGPYCVVGPDVKIGQGTRLIAHVVLMGATTLGEGNVLSPFCSIGGEPQDHSYQGSPTRVEIGDHNVFRESVTVNRGTEKEDGLTKIGCHNYFMTGSHVAHDCKLGDHINIANCSMLGGHVHVESHAGISGGVAVHHFVTVGGYCFVGGLSRIYHDAPPYMLIDGNPARIRCINVVGLKRNGLGSSIESLHEAHRLLYRAKMSLEQADEILHSHEHMSSEVLNLMAFLNRQRQGKHGRAREKGRSA